MWSTYLQQFHPNVKYNKVITNRVFDFLSQPPVVAVTMVLNFCGHKTSRWSQFYMNNPNFTTTYQGVSKGTPVANFHLQNGLLCHLGHLYIPSRENTKMLLESHYSQLERHFGVEKMVVVLQK